MQLDNKLHKIFPFKVKMQVFFIYLFVYASSGFNVLVHRSTKGAKYYKFHK